MRRLLFAGLFCAALAVAPLAAEGRIQRRQVNQQKRIAGGVASGQLTPRETTKLERKEAALNKEIRRDRKDGGGLSPRERVKIEHQQDRMSKKIYKEKHDRDHAKR